jgi:hypothetical protein
MIDIYIYKLAVLMLCTFTNPKVEQKPIKGKVVYISCATVVVQITDSSHKDLGQNKWRRTPIDNEYKNVFVIKNRCTFLESKIQRGEEFSFLIKQDGIVDDCKPCTLFDNLPNVALNIQPLKIKD